MLVGAVSRSEPHQRPDQAFPSGLRPPTGESAAPMESSHPALIAVGSTITAQLTCGPRHRLDAAGSLVAHSLGEDDGRLHPALIAVESTRTAQLTSGPRHRLDAAGCLVARSLGEDGGERVCGVPVS